jgi:anti-sigma factor RsiW
MTPCTFSKAQVMAWLDGETGNRAEAVAAHVAACPSCQQDVASWRSTGRLLRAEIDLALGEVDTLAALSALRNRLAREREASWRGALQRWWEDAWLFHRRAIAGVVVAAALGALSAPAVVWWLGRLTQRGAGFPLAGVVVESLEVGNRATAVVVQENNSATTLIWIEPAAEDSHHEQKP